MEDISYIHKEQYLVNFGEYGKLLFPEATASECFEHSFSLQRDPLYSVKFITDFIDEYGSDIDIEKIGIDKLYKEISKRRFAEFFSEEEQKSSGDSSPFYVLLDVLAEKVGDPYQFIEKRTWRQCMAVIKGSIYRSRAGTKEGDKENRDMVRKDKANPVKDKKVTEAVQSVVDQYIKSNK